MQDITQATEGHQVTFSADTKEADLWMTATYDSDTVVFALPEEASEASDFRAAAEAAGLKVSSF